MKKPHPWFHIGWHDLPPEVAMHLGLEPDEAEGWGISLGKRCWLFAHKGYPLGTRAQMWRLEVERETYQPKAEPEVEERRDNR